MLTSREMVVAAPRRSFEAASTVRVALLDRFSAGMDLVPVVKTMSRTGSFLKKRRRWGGEVVSKAGKCWSFLIEGSGQAADAIRIGDVDLDGCRQADNVGPGIDGKLRRSREEEQDE